jgi:hypothetical protein
MMPADCYHVVGSNTTMFRPPLPPNIILAAIQFPRLINFMFTKPILVAYFVITLGLPAYPNTCTIDESISSPKLQLLSVQRIWDQAPHNAFTDLVHFNNRWFCVFREGSTHASSDGAIRIITSLNGTTWETAALLKSPNSDLRDAKITITPDQRLMLTGAEALHDKSNKSHQSLAWFSNDGFNWSEKIEIGDPNFWLWRVSWHKQTAYSVGYSCTDKKSTRLYHSTDGHQFSPIVANLFSEGYTNESSIVFDHDQAICLLRRDGNPNSAQLGLALPPYTNWTWKDLNIPIGGPNLIRLPEGQLLAAVRLLDGQTRTSLCWINTSDATIHEALTLPSGGDTSYAGLTLQDNILWISYYSSHEQKSSIYLAKVRIGRNAIDIGSRRELFIDPFLIDQQTSTSLQLHSPKRSEPSPQPGNPLEYGTVIRDGTVYRLYTREARGAKFDGDSTEVTRYCESTDGIHWTQPNLGLVEIDGTKDNNVILNEPPFSHNFAPFLDRNPNVSPDQRFKALAGTRKSGLVAFTSSDGIRWSKLASTPVIQYTKEYAFDSQNVSFWSEAEQRYACFFRHFLDKKLRSVCRTHSADFIHWSEPIPLKPNFPDEHLYTTLTQPYFRAPHIYIATPTRFYPDRGESTDILFMSARGNAPFDRTFRHAWIRPGLDPQRWGNRSNYAAWNIVQTSDTEMSIYTTPFQRFTMRLDGIASLHADANTGEMLTKPLQFTGTNLELNFSTSAGGSIRIEIQDAAGIPLPEFSLDNAIPLVGDSIAANYSWKDAPSLASLENKPIRLRFVMQDADIYSLRFHHSNEKPQ